MRLGRSWGLVLAMLAMPAIGHADGGASSVSGQLLYSKLTGGYWQIWQADLATGQQQQLTMTQTDKRYPAWAPDGAFAYHTSNHEAYWQLAGQPPQPLLQPLWPVKDLAWSTDQRVAFVRFRTDLNDSANLWVSDAQGASPMVLTHEAGIQYNSAWSPDGKWIAYSGGHGYGTYELYVISADGSTRRQLTRNSSHEFLPAWSPDGQWIAYSSDATGDFEIWVMHPDGSQPTAVTHSPGLDTRPAWSPDSTHIAFATNRSRKLEIWSIRPDGSEARPIVSAEQGVCDPAWR